MEEARTLKDRQAERKGQSLLGSEGGLSKAMVPAMEICRDESEG